MGSDRGPTTQELEKTLMRRATFIRSAAVAAALLAVAGAGTASAAQVAPILAQEQATVCFQLGPVALPPGATTATLKLVFRKLDAPAQPRMWALNGLDKGTNGSAVARNYTNQLSGTAVLGKPSNDRPGGLSLKIGLTGTDYGLGAGAGSTSDSPGVWGHDLALLLNPKTLAGTFAGTSTFTPIVADGQAGAASTLVTLQPLRRISCRSF